MAEATVLVCDVCGRPARETVTIRIGRANWQKDLCQTHLSELTAGARKPRPGRRRGVVAADSVPKRRGRPPGSKNKTPAKRRGRPPKPKTESETATPAAAE
jgi:hypothetical protein